MKIEKGVYNIFGHTVIRCFTFQLTVSFDPCTLDDLDDISHRYFDIIEVKIPIFFFFIQHRLLPINPCFTLNFFLHALTKLFLSYWLGYYFVLTTWLGLKLRQLHTFISLPKTFTFVECQLVYMQNPNSYFVT